MKEVFDLLDRREKRITILLCCLLGVALLFFLLGSLPQIRHYSKLVSSLRSKEKSYQTAGLKTSKRREEWLKWQQAQKDLEDLGKKYFYAKDVQPKLRLDLERIFNEAGVRVSLIEFTYSELKKEKTNRVNITFNLRSSYPSLKKFIHLVEQFPKFLVIEKIDFLSSESAQEILELRVILAGYYES
jgi:Tfp pilus assembly protein PilO